MNRGVDSILWVSRDPSAEGGFRISVVTGELGAVPRTLRAVDRLAAETILINYGASIAQALVTVAKVHLKGEGFLSIDLEGEPDPRHVPK